MSQADVMPVDELVARVMFNIKNNALLDKNLDPEVRWALDATLKDMVTKTQFSAFKKDKTFTTAIGRHTYSFEPDFVQILTYGMRYALTPFTQIEWISERDFLDFQGEEASGQSDPLRFFITTKDPDDGLWRFRLSPTPGRAMDIIYTYLSMPVNIWNTVAAADHVLDPRFPTQFHQALVYGASTKFPQYLDAATLQLFMHEYENAIKVMANKSEPTSGALLQKRAYGGPSRPFGPFRRPSVRLWG